MYTTAFDRLYLTRGLAMLESLLGFEPYSEVTVLCLDNETQVAVQELQLEHNVSILMLDDLGADLISKIKDNREYREFCWTLGSLLCRHLLAMNVEEVIYLDADIYFFNNPEVLVEEARKGDLAAIAHRFPTRLKKYEINGKYNVQWIYFANTTIGRRASDRWATQCINCCSYLPRQGIVGDQKYLDEWPMIYSSFVDIKNIGAGVAPWNHEIYQPNYGPKGWVVNGMKPLIFYHFQGLKIFEDGEVEMAGPKYSKVIPLPAELYEQYLKKLAEVHQRYSHLINESAPDKWFVHSCQNHFCRLYRRFKRKYLKK